MSNSTDISIAIAEVLDSKQALRIISSLEGNNKPSETAMATCSCAGMARETIN